MGKNNCCCIGPCNNKRQLGKIKKRCYVVAMKWQHFSKNEGRRQEWIAIIIIGRENFHPGKLKWIRMFKPFWRWWAYYKVLKHCWTLFEFLKLKASTMTYWDEKYFLQIHTGKFVIRQEIKPVKLPQNQGHQEKCHSKQNFF